VTCEVERWRAKRIRNGSADDREVLDALERARALQEGLVSIVEALERRQARQVEARDDPW
jgi:hypothetical protein